MERRRKTIVLAVVVLAAGLALAWQFRRPAGPRFGHAGEFSGDVAAAPAENTPGDSSANDAAPSAAQVTLSGRIEPVDESAGPSSGTHAATLAATKKRLDPAASPDPPSAFPDADHTCNSPAEPDSPRSSSIPDMHSEAPYGEVPAEETHTVVDGDTLPALAKRYLGSADRAGEIFAYNRDVLSDPDMLPIGAELRIPSRRISTPANTPSNSSGQTPARPVGDPRPSSPANGPLGNGPQSNDSSATPPSASVSPASGLIATGLAISAPPTLIPLPPTGGGQPAGSRAYVVQPGDTLWDIARRFYGDSRQSALLLGANRDRLRGPQDLRPGMVLIVP